jgi:tetratricopeptide (TPR) repeat protein
MAVQFFVQGDYAASQGDLVNGLRLLKIAATMDSTSFMIKKRILEVMLDMAQQVNETIPEVLVYAQEMFINNLYDSDVLVSLAQAYLLNNLPEDALTTYDLKLTHDPQGEDYLRIFVIKAKYLKQLDYTLLDKAYELSNNNTMLIRAIADIRSQFQPDQTVDMIKDALENNFDVSLMDIALKILENKQDEETILDLLNKHISSLAEYQKGILIEIQYNRKEFEKIVSNFDLFYDTNELQIQKYLFFACIGKDHLYLLDRIYDRLVSNPDITPVDIEVVTMMAAESWWMTRNPEKTAEYLAKHKDFGYVHEFFIKRFISDFSDEEVRNIDYLLSLLSDKGMNQSYEDFLFARKYYLNEDSLKAYSYARKVDPKVLVGTNLVSALAIIYLQSGDDIEGANKLFSLRSEEETISINEIYGQYYYKKQDYDQAFKYLDMEIEENPKPSLYVFQLKISLLDRDKRYDDEVKVLEQALVHYPDEALLLNALAYLLTITGNISEKIPFYLELALQLDPDNVNYIDSYGWYYYHIGEYRKAGESMQKIIKLGFDSSVIAYHIGAVYERLDDPIKAIEYYEKAKMLNNDDEAVADATKALSNLKY